jgi:hypothetical protein
MNCKTSREISAAPTRPPRLLSLLPLAILAALGLAACGSAPATTTSQNPATEASAAPAENGAGNGEAAPHPYTNAKFKYRVDAPGTMVEADNGSAAYNGTVERLQIDVVSGAKAGDPRSLATADAAALGAKLSAFKLVQPPAQINLAGRNIYKFIYTWTDGANPVTGRPNMLVSVLYYIPKNSSTLAALTYSIAATQYDPQGADDVASTFRWL